MIVKIRFNLWQRIRVLLGQPVIVELDRPIGHKEWVGPFSSPEAWLNPKRGMS